MSNIEPKMSSKKATNRYPMPFVRLELVVMTILDGNLAVLLGQREAELYRGKWALPGGVLRIDKDQDLEAAAQRVAKERLGSELPYLKQLVAVGSANRDPRAAWAVSIAYRALIPVEGVAPMAGKRIVELRWAPVDEAAKDQGLAFDHAELIKIAAETTRANVEAMELPFAFIPAEFTLGELQSICESILGRALDKSSFRRKLDDRDLVKPINGKMRTGAFRPAQLYRQG